MKSFRCAIFLMLAVALPVRAYVLNYNSITNARHWNFLAPSASVPTNVLNRTTHAVRFFLAADGYSATNTTAELNNVRAAFGQWQAISNTVIKLEDAGLVAPPADVNTSDGTNVIYWVKGTTLVNGGLSDISGALGVTYTLFTTTSNELLQADIVFNGDLYQWFADFFNTNAGSAILVEGVALHEIGHFIGLGHSPLGGATMFYSGGSGVNVQDGLSSDDIAGARFLYSTTPASFGAITGAVTLSGSPVVGAIVVAEDSSSNAFAGTLTWTNGNFAMNALPAGTYNLHVSPLDPSADRGVDALCTGPDITPVYNNAFTSFAPSTNQSVTVAAGGTVTVNFIVSSNVQPFRIADVRAPTANSGSYSWSGLPIAMTVGQSNFTIGVASSNLPTSSATITITGDGLTVGAPVYLPNAFSTGLNFISVSISVASNATPGLRSFIVQQGTNIARAEGFLKIRPAILDYNFDGLDDAFQRTYFPVFTATNAAPTADPDSDGMNNSQEYIAGTNPTNAASLLKIQSVLRAGNTATVNWQSVISKQYQVFVRTNFTTATWQAVGSTITATNTSAQFADGSATNTTRFYRVQVSP